MVFRICLTEGKWKREDETFSTPNIKTRSLDEYKTEIHRAQHITSLED